jgi:hypothetical protein
MPSHFEVRLAKAPVVSYKRESRHKRGAAVIQSKYEMTAARNVSDYYSSFDTSGAKTCGQAHAAQASISNSVTP